VFLCGNAAYRSRILLDTYVPVSVEVVAGFVSQRGAEVEAALVDEELDELSKRKKERKKKKKKNIALAEDGVQCADEKRSAFSLREGLNSTFGSPADRD